LCKVSVDLTSFSGFSQIVHTAVLTGVAERKWPPIPANYTFVVHHNVTFIVNLYYVYLRYDSESFLAFMHGGNVCASCMTYIGAYW
jgi:hypothetical protein